MSYALALGIALSSAVFGFAILMFVIIRLKRNQSTKWGKKMNMSNSAETKQPPIDKDKSTKVVPLLTDKAIRFRIITAGVCLLAMIILSVIAINVFDENTAGRTYISSSDPETILTVKNNEYFLNGEEMEYQVRPPGEVIGHFVGQIASPWPYYIGIVFLIFAIVRSVRKIPPNYRIYQAFGGRSKRIPDEPITLKEAPGGIIAVRYWKVKEGQLVSIATKTVWEGTRFEADCKPLIGGWKGIYGTRLGTKLEDVGQVGGIVSLSGQTVGHKDSIIRAEYCDILLLITNKPKHLEALRANYDCPVFFNRSINESIYHWLMTREGIFWLNHNMNLIDQKIWEKMESDIEESIEGEGNSK